MLTIIPAHQNNLEEIANLFDQYRVFYKMPSSLAAVKNFISARLVQKDTLIFIAYTENHAVGFMQIYRSFSSIAMQPIWILNDLYVESLYRRIGCARKMMVYLQDKAAQEKVFSIKLATAVNNDKAKSLYHSLDYQLNDGFDHYSKRIG